MNVNLQKSEIILVGEIDNQDDLAKLMGCKKGALPSIYLGLPLGAKFKVKQFGMLWSRNSERESLCRRGTIYERVKGYI